MKTATNVPYYSQHDASIEEAWRPRICGIACVKMILEYLAREESPSIMNLIKEGLAMNGYEARGWYHQALTKLLRNWGVPAYNQEFVSGIFNQREGIIKATSDEGNPILEKGIEKLKVSLENNFPIIVSVGENFDENTSTHLILLTGIYEDEYGFGGFYYHDPNAKEGKKENLFVDLVKFKNYWRKTAIFVN